MRGIFCFACLLNKILTKFIPRLIICRKLRMIIKKVKNLIKAQHFMKTSVYKIFKEIMRMKKKIIAVLAMALLTVSFAACKGNDNGNSAQNMGNGSSGGNAESSIVTNNNNSSGIVNSAPNPNPDANGDNNNGNNTANGNDVNNNGNVTDGNGIIGDGDNVVSDVVSGAGDVVSGVGKGVEDVVSGVVGGAEDILGNNRNNSSNAQ